MLKLAMMKSRDHLQTMAHVYREICEGKEPWVALGNFLNYWFTYAKERREDLVRDPLPEALTEEYYQQWAAYCAPSVEHLCHTYKVACPKWVGDSKYILSSTWYYYPQDYLRAQLVATTPEEFHKRNIFSGNRMFLNKWELVEQYRHGVNSIV